MKTPSDSKIIAKLALWHIVLLALVLLASCNSARPAETPKSAATGFVLKTPVSAFRQCRNEDVAKADSIMSRKWDDDRSRWHGYSSFNGGQ